MPASTVITVYRVRGLVICEACADREVGWNVKAFATSVIRIDNRTLLNSDNVLACGSCNGDIPLFPGSDGHLSAIDCPSITQRGHYVS
jgi:hypothetical protein